MSVLIVDDHPFSRHRAVLLESQGFYVVGEAEDGSSALEAVAGLHPQIVLSKTELNQ